jgi:hypothetical protein
MTFYNIATAEHIKIVEVVLCASHCGPGSQTPYFKFYDINKFPGSPLYDDDFEYQPCAELLRSTDSRWDEAANDGTIIAMTAAYTYYTINRSLFVLLYLMMNLMLPITLIFTLHHNFKHSALTSLTLNHSRLPSQGRE